MSIFFPKMQKPKGFNYQPIYWNPDKERREEMVKKAKRDLGMLIEDESSFSPDDFRGVFSKDKKVWDVEKRTHGGSNVTLILLLFVILFGAYFLYFVL